MRQAKIIRENEDRLSAVLMKPGRKRERGAEMIREMREYFFQKSKREKTDIRVEVINAKGVLRKAIQCELHLE